MDLYLTARPGSFELSPAIRQYVEKRLVKAVESHSDAHDLVRMEVQLTHFEHEARVRCHVLLQLPAHKEINITEETHDVYEAIDLAEKRLKRNLTEERQRQLTEKRQEKFQKEALDLEEDRSAVSSAARLDQA
ncbi:MAG: ribosome hibernation-promoting factor, HPF/YfiA family [Myxococcales bacterium]